MLKFNKDFIKNYDQNSDEGHVLEVDVKYTKNLCDFPTDSPFLSERMNIIKGSELVCNLYDKNNYVIYIRSLKQSLDHGIIFTKVHKVIQLNQEVWLRKDIYMNTKWKTETKNDFEKEFKLISQVLERQWKM